MRVALVHDYLKEYGGAERVLKVLSQMYPDAPIYTAFADKSSVAWKEFENKDVRECFLAPLLKIGNLYSPLRFLTPVIWRSFDLSEYDLVITSSSWYITRGFRTGQNTKVICYCHTPPRWLYGYETSVGFTKYWPVRVYALIVGHFMRMYDYASAQNVDYWIANSKNVARRIKKFYRKESQVIYPPVDVQKIIEKTKNIKKEDFFLIVSRIVGAKGLEEAAKAFKDSEYKLKIVGEAKGYSDTENSLKKLSGGNIELLGRVSDDELYELYGRAKGFIALARDEDFGITPVEAMAAGTPVVAFNGGGFKESVVNGVTGILINDTSEAAIGDALKALDVLSKKSTTKNKCIKQSKKFSIEIFKDKISSFCQSSLR